MIDLDARIVATPDGPAVLIPAGGDARTVALLVRKHMAATSPALGRDLRLMALVRLLLLAEDHHEAGVGFPRETDTGGPVVEWVSTSQFGEARGCSRQAVRKAAERGDIPGAELHAGRWLIPSDADWWPTTTSTEAI